MQILSQPKDVLTNEVQWWFIYNSDTGTILQEPIQCLGKTSSPYTMVVADTKDECDTFITQNNLN